ncbi:hypothetical protein IDJ77_16295 [Mucilaginibacter sp. ZT4R22]|uniref:Uncharacterized protein n=1 Tax=Mucilaginibacter pankratovii TaxID=2772110 RepID=A0ABR7WSU2_9SPHI|nr:hypothetical protein [Mucilaginibacter pankratovii]MBD1365375.1 hypothetical protein [Mucilaginibacter pankratovii]
MSIFKINTFIYREFIAALREAIIKQEFKNKKVTKATDVFKRTTRFFKEVLSLAGLNDEKYLSRKVNEFPFPDVLFISINTMAFLRALDYIDKKYDAADKKKNISHEEHAQRKLEEFAKDRECFDEYLAIEKASRLFQSELLKMDTKAEPALITLENPAKQKEQFQKVTEVVESFFKHLNTRENYEAAWGLLSSRFKNRWYEKKDDKEPTEAQTLIAIKKFAEGYKNTLGLHKIHVFGHRYPHDNSDNVIECLVYYKDQMRVRSTNEFASGNRGYKARNAKDFANDVDKFIKQFQPDKQPMLKTFHLNMFFKPTLSEHIRVVCKLSDDDMEVMFTEPYKTNVDRLMAYQLRKEGDDWLIDSSEDQQVVRLR